jgi:hypothetical protein
LEELVTSIFKIEEYAKQKKQREACSEMSVDISVDYMVLHPIRLYDQNMFACASVDISVDYMVLHPIRLYDQNMFACASGLLDALGR